MKKILLTCAVAMSLSLVSSAQTFRFGIGPAISLPIGDLADFNGIGIGAEVTGIVELSESFEAFGQAGYQSFLGKKIDYFGGTLKTESLNHVPVIVGARYKTGGFLVGGGIGFASWGKNASGFAFSPQIGYSTEKIDVIGQFHSTLKDGSSLSYVGIKAYYKF
ncbi:MAG: hypothetical protein HZA79_05580 [Sphingobacteriales bacterium]|nr:hypothetical protein [Sphingobacteriales bacterium]